jgi:putative flippase GtrA
MRLRILSTRNLLEFVRYAVVGGIAALADMGVLWLITTLAFGGKNTGWQLFCSVAAGFLVGLTLNWILSLLFVFIGKEQREKGKSLRAYLLYAAVGLVGFGMTEGLMHLGMLFVPAAGLWYLLLNGFVKCIVLVWNYIGRKLLVYRGT